MRSKPKSEASESIEFTTKSILPRIEAHKSKDKYVQDYWAKVDDLFYRTIGHAESAFKINMYINVIIVAVGIGLLGYSAAYSWINGLDIYSTAFGGLGVASFISTFYLTPQRKIQKIVGDLTQIQLFYRTYYMQAEAISDWLYSNQKNMTLDDLNKINKQLEELTNGCVDKIENYIGKD